MIDVTDDAAARHLEKERWSERRERSNGIFREVKSLHQEFCSG